MASNSKLNTPTVDTSSVIAARAQTAVTNRIFSSLRQRIEQLDTVAKNNTTIANQEFDARLSTMNDTLQFVRLESMNTVLKLQNAGGDLSGPFTNMTVNSIQGIPAKDFTSNLPTGISYGGILSVNANPAKFNITAGVGHIHSANGSTTADVNPVFTPITWAAQTAVTLTYLATHDVTYIYINSSGVVSQQTTPFSNGDYDNNIIIGLIGHSNRTSIAAISTFPTVSYATDRQYHQFMRSFGPLKLSGHTITANAGANLTIDRSLGVAFALGRNYETDPNNPSVVNDAAQTACFLFYYYRTATPGVFTVGTGTSNIQSDAYDNGDGTLGSVTPNKFTIQRVFHFPREPGILGVYYGRKLYNSQQIAIDNIPIEQFDEDTSTATSAVFLGYIIIKEGASDLTDPLEFRFVGAGLLRNTIGGSSSSSTVTLDDLSDVIITSPAATQILTYNGAAWVNAAPAPATTPSPRDLSTSSSECHSAADFVTYTGFGSNRFDIAGLATEDHPGILRSSTSTNSTAYAGIGTATMDQIIFADGTAGAATFTAIVRIPTLSAGSQRFFVSVGFMASVNQISPGGAAMFRYRDNLSTGNWQCFTGDADFNSTIVDSGITVVAGTWYTLQCTVTPTVPSVVYKINGTVVSTTTTNLPIGLSPIDALYSLMGLGCGITKSIGTTALFLETDYIDMTKGVTR